MAEATIAYHGDQVTSQTASLPPALDGTVFTLDCPGFDGHLTCYAAEPAHATNHSPLVLIHTVNAAASAHEVRPLFSYHRAHRPVYALDLPGYGRTARPAKPYTPRLMTDAVLALVAEVRQRHQGRRVDAVGVSLGTEFLARAATEQPDAFRSLALVSPTGLSGRPRYHGPVGSTRELSVMKALLVDRPWGPMLFRWLTRPSVIRYFLERTWGRKEIDEELWRYCVRTAREAGAEFAPLTFLSGGLFSNDINTLYEVLSQPVWMSHGVSGDFVNYRGKISVAARPNWTFTVHQTGALPYFERPAEFFAAHEAFLAKCGA